MCPKKVSGPPTGTQWGGKLPRPTASAGPAGWTRTPILSPVPSPALGTHWTLSDSGWCVPVPGCGGRPPGGCRSQGGMAKGEMAVAREATLRFRERDRKEGISVCEQGILGIVILDARAPGVGALGLGLPYMVLLCQGWWEGWGCRSYDLRGRARPPMTAPGSGANCKGFVLERGLFKGSRLGGSRGLALPGFQCLRAAGNPPINYLIHSVSAQCASFWGDNTEQDGCGVCLLELVQIFPFENVGF